MAAKRVGRTRPDHLTSRDRERSAPRRDRGRRDTLGMVRLHPVLIGARQTARCVPLDDGLAVKTATHRAAEAIKAAEVMFADEIGATLDLSPAARVAPITTIAAAIEAAVVEEQERLTCVQ
jgi:hypothetical protein